VALFSVLGEITSEKHKMNEKIKNRYMTLRLPADVERDLRKLAEENTRTLAAQILHFIKLGLARSEKEKS
jgi:hypothetical protein